MHRIIVAALVAVAACLGLSGVAVAQDPEPVVPPAFAPPTPGPVVDVASAEAFTEDYATDNARRFLRTRAFVRVLDANAACLEHPVIEDRFGCVFTERVLTIERIRSHRDHRGHSSKRSTKGDPGDDHGKRDHRRRVRVRTYGCLGLLSVQGGADVEARGILRAVECTRVRNGDYEAPEPVA